MSAFRIQGLPSRWLWAGLALVLAIGVFAGGALTGRAINSDDGPKVTRVNFVSPNTGANPESDARDGDDAVGSGGGITAPSGPVDSDLRYWPWCPAPLPAGVVGNTIDPSAAGIAMRLLGSGFELQSISLRGEGDCDDNGVATNVHPVLDSSWIHSESGMQVYVSQRESDQVANYLDAYSAMVWSDGYLFQLSLSGGPVYPLIERGDVDFSVEEPTNEEMLAVMEEVISQVAPDVPEGCFYRVVVGDWDDLSALGIGDPRPAIPAGYTENYVTVRVLQDPDDGCGGGELEGYYGASFDSSFNDGSGGWIGVSAYEVLEGEAYPGYVQPGYIYWTDGTWQFNVSGYGSDGTPLAVEALQAIATALQPDFSQECFAADTELTVEDVVAAGFNEPTAPEGFSLESSRFNLNDVPADCDSDTEIKGNGYSLVWTFSDGAGSTVEVQVSRPLEGPTDIEYGPGYINQFAVQWTNEDGTGYFISLYSPDGEPALSRDALIALAQSVDPDLDPDSLEEGGDFKPLPMPDQPSPGTGAGDDGSSSSGAAE